MRILIAEDDPILAKSLVVSLRECWYSVDCVSVGPPRRCCARALRRAWARPLQLSEERVTYHALDTVTVVLPRADDQTARGRPKEV